MDLSKIIFITTNLCCIFISNTSFHHHDFVRERDGEMFYIAFIFLYRLGKYSKGPVAELRLSVLLLNLSLTLYVFDAKISCVILNLFSNYLLLVYKNAFYFYIFNIYSYSGTLQNLSNKFSILLINSTWCLKYTIMISVIKDILYLSIQSLYIFSHLFSS